MKAVKIMLDPTTPDAAALFAAASSASGTWHLLHTKSRQEKAISETLLAMGIAHYLPLVNVSRTYGGRKVPMQLPLFPGYLFLKGAKEAVYATDRTKRVANIIPIADQIKIVWELRNLSMALTSTAPLDPYQYLRAGVKVEVRSGPLLGLQGVIESRVRLVIRVELRKCRAWVPWVLCAIGQRPWSICWAYSGTTPANQK